MKFKEKSKNNVLVMRSKDFNFVFGLFFTFSSFPIIHFALFGMISEQGRWIIGITGLFFLITGLYHCSIRKRIYIDKKNAIVEVSRGLMIPSSAGIYEFKNSKKIYEFKKFIYVNVRKIRRSRGSESTTLILFPVRLIGTETVMIDETDDIIKSRRMAKKIAKHMGIPLHDTSFGAVKICEADAIGRSVRDRIQRRGKKLKLPICPKNPKSAVRSDDNTLFVNIPRAPLSCLPIILIFVIGPISGNLMSLAIRSINTANTETGDWAFLAGHALLILLAVFFLLLLLTLIFGMFRAFSIEVGQDGIRIIEKRLFWRYTIFMTTDEIEELYAGKDLHSFYGKNGVLILSERKMVTFAEHLPKEECEYLAAIITKALVS